MSDVIPLHPKVELPCRPYVAIFAPPESPMSIGLITAAGASLAMYPTVHVVCEQLGRLGLDPALRRRPQGPAFKGPVPTTPGLEEQALEFSAEHFLLVLWFDDGEVEVDDQWCRQLRPPQMFYASFLGWLRAGFTVQREWASLEIQQAAAQQRAAGGGIVVPRN